MGSLSLNVILYERDVTHPVMVQDRPCQGLHDNMVTAAFIGHFSAVLLSTSHLG